MDVFSLSLIVVLGFITGHQRRQIRLLWVEVGRTGNRAEFRDNHLLSQIILLGHLHDVAQNCHQASRYSGPFDNRN